MSETRMTPEERARATLAKRGNDVELNLSGKDPMPRGVEVYMVAAIRAAEDDTLDRAEASLLEKAAEIERLRSPTAIALGGIVREMAERIRSLKSGSAKP